MLIFMYFIKLGELILQALSLLFSLISWDSHSMYIVPFEGVPEVPYMVDFLNPFSFDFPILKFTDSSIFSHLLLNPLTNFSFQLW